MANISSRPLTHNLGYPRIGERRELKRATEAYWGGKLTADELEATGRELRAARWRRQAQAGIDLVPSNDWSLYDHVLDTICLLGAVPSRLDWDGGPIGIDTYFRLARGSGRLGSAEGASAHEGGTLPLEMTKWFDTNYHYLVPELGPAMRFALSSSKPFDELAEAAALGIPTMPVLLGPVSFLMLGKPADGVRPFDALDLLPGVLPVYGAVLRRLAAGGARWVQLDEPVFALDLDDRQRAALRETYTRLAAAAPELELLVATYFGALGPNLATLVELPVRAAHVDAVRGADELDAVADALPAGKMLSVGIVDGRNIWRTDLDRCFAVLERLAAGLGNERLIVAPSCSLLHVPITTRRETRTDREPLGWLAFADQKLDELRALADALTGERDEAFWHAQRAAVAARRSSPLVHNAEVGRRVAGIAAADYRRALPCAERRRLQYERLKLPPLPTTTIGSFPQTGELRRVRAQWRSGAITAAEYERFLERAVDELIDEQAALGLDLLVHGEFERNDMVEYFGEQLDGYLTTEHGWVQSYGTRYVKPPIILGDVARRGPMTVRWLRYAQQRAARPVKGMLTGPITLAKWSFVRDDKPLAEVVRQIALAIRDEVVDLEQAGIAAIQIDEPALREGLPLRRAERDAYLQWAVGAFRLAAGGAGASTQIHSHMCYAEFGDIMAAIAALDVDVISIEAARSGRLGRAEGPSGTALLQALLDFSYPNEIGPGVYDIHSPRVPSADEIEQLLRRAASVLPLERLWANPDCGLKTRSWDEVRPALRNLVVAAKRLRVALTSS